MLTSENNDKRNISWYIFHSFSNFIYNYFVMHHRNNFKGNINNKLFTLSHNIFLSLHFEFLLFANVGYLLKFQVFS